MIASYFLKVTIQSVLSFYCPQLAAILKEEGSCVGQSHYSRSHRAG